MFYSAPNFLGPLAYMVYSAPNLIGPLMAKVRKRCQRCHKEINITRTTRYWTQHKKACVLKQPKVEVSRPSLAVWDIYFRNRGTGAFVMEDQET